jgi:hypothetical protein
VRYLKISPRDPSTAARNDRVNRTLREQNRLTRYAALPSVYSLAMEFAFPRKGKPPDRFRANDSC